MKKMLIFLNMLSLVFAPYILKNETQYTNQQLRTEESNLIQNVSFSKHKNYYNNEGQVLNVQDAGINKYESVFLHHILSLSHDLTQWLHRNITLGPDVIAKTILAVCPNTFPLAHIAIANIFYLHWDAYEVASFDKGQGVTVKMFGIVLPAYIEKVASQL